MDEPLLRVVAVERWVYVRWAGPDGVPAFDDVEHALDVRLDLEDFGVGGGCWCPRSGGTGRDEVRGSWIGGDDFAEGGEG